MCCIGCGQLEMNGICGECKYEWQVEHAVVFSERGGALKTLIDEYKFGHKRSASNVLAMLAGTLLPFSAPATIVPIPTIARHIRQRGYDHMTLLARRVAKQNRLDYSPLLTRHTQTVQHGATKRDRLAQAETAFGTARTIDPNRVYIILDDITTTGASLRAAARVLRAAGATRVWTVALARQPLEEPLDDRG